MAQMLYEVEKTYGKDKTSHTEAMLTIKHMLRSQMDLIQQGIATPDVDTINLRNAQDVMKATRKAIEEINTFK